MNFMFWKKKKPSLPLMLNEKMLEVVVHLYDGDPLLLCVVGADQVWSSDGSISLITDEIMIDKAQSYSREIIYEGCNHGNVFYPAHRIREVVIGFDIRTKEIPHV